MNQSGMIFRKLIFSGILIFVFFVFTLPRAVGLYLEPKLEKNLTELFGMKVTLEHLHGQPFSGHVWAERITFWNQPQFSNRPHLDIRGIEFDIDYWALRDKRVIIRNAVFNHPFYLLERIATPEGTKNNIVTWWHHIRQKIHQHNEGGEDDGRQWFVSINHVVFYDGTFIFHDMSNPKIEKKLVFQKFNAVYEGFSWRTISPLLLSQKIFISGLFGERNPSPFKIYGRANFATSDISFRLEGLIQDGDLEEQKNLWEGLPIEIRGGKFDLKTRAVCILDQLKSKSLLTMKSVKVAPGPSPVEKIWGLPMQASMGFIQNQKVIRLKVPVHGNVSDPKFEFFRAFRLAFQESLRKRVDTGIRFLFITPAKFATQTGEALVQRPAKFASEGFEKIATIVVKKTETTTS